MGCPSMADRDALRTLARRMFDAALVAVDPRGALAASLSQTSNHQGSVVVLAAGKAAMAMAMAAIDAVEGPLSGLVVVPDEVVGTGAAASELLRKAGLAMISAGHPVPNTSSLEAGRRAMDLVAGTGPGDLIWVLLSGGSSALLAHPTADLSLVDLQVTAAELIACGASIEEVNTVRKHLSALKGGGLLRAARAPVRTYLLSDVVGDAVDAIGSGPSVPDATTFADAIAVVDAYGLRPRLPHAVVAHLEAGAGGAIPETLKANEAHATVTVIASGLMAAQAACEEASRAGFSARVVREEPLLGEARDVGESLARRAVSLGGGGAQALVFTGETTVTLRGSGVGGRNQELALSAARLLDGHRGLAVASLGTDGVDGPTPAAGAVVDGSTLECGRALGLDASSHLERNDSHTFLEATGDLVVTGPTGTNVADLAFVLSLGDSTP